MADLLQSLSEKGAYPHPVEDLKIVQTHISYVFVTDTFVYKVKKPVDFGFLDNPGKV